MKLHRNAKTCPNSRALMTELTASRVREPARAAVRPHLGTRLLYAWRDMPAEHSRGFRDRLSERGTLERLLHDARNGCSAALVVRGPHG